MVENDLIDVSDLPSPYNPLTSDISNISDLQLLSIDSLKDAKKSFEKEFIHKKLLENDNNVSKTAKAIGVERSYLHKLIKRNITKQEICQRTSNNFENHQWQPKRKKTAPLSGERHSPHLGSNQRGHIQYSVPSRPRCHCFGSIFRKWCFGNRGPEQRCENGNLYRHCTCRYFAAKK